MSECAVVEDLCQYNLSADEAMDGQLVLIAKGTKGRKLYPVVSALINVIEGKTK